MLSSLKFNYYRFKYNYGKSLPLKTPVDVSLELASLCNQWCGYCYHADKKNLPFTKGIMELDTALNIIESSAKYGVNSLKFNWKGESTLNPNFEYITKHAKLLANDSVFIERISNSNFKFKHNDDSVFRGFSNNTKVKISFDSFRKDVFEYQRAGGKHDLALKNIDKFYNWPGRKTEIVIQAVRTNLNKDEDLKGEIKKRWPEATASIRDVVAGRVETDTTEFIHKGRNFDNRIPCKQAFVRLIFNWEGKAFPCCPDIKEELYLGSIDRNSIKEIFNSYQAKKLRKELKDKSAFNFDPCKTCSSFESYKGYKPSWTS